MWHCRVVLQPSMRATERRLPVKNRAPPPTSTLTPLIYDVITSGDGHVISDVMPGVTTNCRVGRGECVVPRLNHQRWSAHSVQPAGHSGDV